MKKTVIRLISAFMLMTAGAVTMGFSSAETASSESGAITVIDGTIKDGIFADSIDLSGMTADEATAAVNNYIAALQNGKITLNTASGNSAVVTAGDLGLSWSNKGLITSAMNLGRSGNIIKRYKAITDLQKQSKVFKIEMTIDETKTRQVLSADCAIYDCPAKDATLTRSDGAFNIVLGQDGQTLNTDESVKVIDAFFAKGYSGEDASLNMVIDTDKPKGDTETLSRIKDVLGTFTTSYKSSGADRSANVANGCAHVNGHIIYPGEQFSVYGAVSPFTEENGYHMAGSYLNGLVVESLGGGICQVSSTLYNAVLRAELQIDQRQNHSMVVDYVPHSGDAAISGTEKDFKFTNNLEYPVYIEGYTSDKTITFTVYGVETRPANREISFESVDTETTQPVGEIVVGDSSQPAGFVKTQSAHTGYKSQYWKIVKVDGVETERTQINSSTYKAVPKTLTMGTATANAVTAAAIQSAIATQSIDYCKAVAASVALDGGAGALAQQQAAAQSAAASANAVPAQ